MDERWRGAVICQSYPPGHGLEAGVDGATIRLPGYGAFFGTIPPRQRHQGGSDG